MGRREEGREGGEAFPGETGPQDVQQDERERGTDWRLVEDQALTRSVLLSN